MAWRFNPCERIGGDIFNIQRVDEEQGGVLYVYGEPNAPAVMDNWRIWPPPGSALLEQVLLGEGYLVATIDSRVATAETKAMENRILKIVSGEVEVADLTAGVRWFKQQPWIDPERVGIWGWSGGGTTTLLMMTRSQEFKADIAVAPASTGGPTTPSTPSPT